MTYRLEITIEAQNDISGLSGFVRAQAIQILRRLRENPRPPRAKELRGKRNFYRIWLARKWRVVYEIDDEARSIIILRVRLKEQIDYDSV
jgi:mRNA-degrading endonuclease RelE of RelBE toxin-antitoxin system